ncbi:MAG: hypothetical protein WBO34_01575 [Gammaproteobacteria bacterium]
MHRINHASDVLTARALLDRAPPSLVAWYAEPLNMASAANLLSRAEVCQQACLRAGESCFRSRVLALICHDWLGSEPEFHYKALTALAREGCERALLELVRGQLLACRKRHGAMECLQYGFRLAAPYLVPDEYFTLLRRHELLASLPYTDHSASPQGLAALLNEAAVINRLRSGERETRTCLHQDTVG